MDKGRVLVVAAVVIAVAIVVVVFTRPGGEPEPTPETATLEGASLPVGAVPPERRSATVRYDAQGMAIGGVEPNPSGGVPLDLDNILAHHDKVVIVSIDGTDTFTVPLPGDPEWADYLEYRRTFRSVLDNTPGFVTAYDPEWRSQLTGVRRTDDPQFELFGGAASSRALLEQVVDRLWQGDEQGLVDLALRKEEFEIICWPAFPQSRPYLRYAWEEAWGFQYASIVGGIKEGMRSAEGRTLMVDSVAYDAIRDYGHFRIHEGVKIGAVDAQGERIELDFVAAVIERNGVFKVYTYAD